MSNRTALDALLPATASRTVLPVALAAALMALVSVPAFAQLLTPAEAITYTGTLGGQTIVLELSDPSVGPLVGRYSYLNKGADIPLHPLSESPSETVLAEEVPCTPALCQRPDGNLVVDPPVGGQFRLHYSEDHAKLSGTWRASASAPVELPVELTRFGERAFDQDGPFYLSFLWMNYGKQITPETSPYDYAKMQVALTEGPLKTLYGATYREVIDPRTKFAFPRIVSLPGGGDVAPINAVLDQNRWATNFAGFDCLSKDYLSAVWLPPPFGTAGNSLGGIDHDKISIDYLSDTVISIHQAGIGSCVGDPYNFVDYQTYDVRAGRVLDPSQIFKHWDATSNRATAPLIDWVIAVYHAAHADDPKADVSCVNHDRLADGLKVSFAEHDIVVFQVVSIGAVSCMGPIIAGPLADIKDLLTAKAVDYFPSLGS
ncbi:MAG: putative exported protein [Devosia sp.]|nr:putative exported protein [Devosia sp.]